MSLSQVLGFIAFAVLLLAGFCGRDVLRKDRGLRLAIRVFLFCSVAALATSFVREPWVVWPLGISMVGAMLFLVRAMNGYSKKKSL